MPIAVHDEDFAGYCTFAETDCLPDVDYYPFIGFVFMDENFRGDRLSLRLINRVIDYAGELRFKNIYITSGEIGPYDKTGSYGNREQVFIREI